MMEFNLIELIQAELLILIAVVYVLGLFLKKIPNIPDWTIPVILLFAAIVLTVVYKAIALAEGFTAVTFVNSVIYGILIAGICVFGNQIFKQTVKRE